MRIITLQLIGDTELENSFERSCFHFRLQETLCHQEVKVMTEGFLKSNVETLLHYTKLK